MTVGFGRVSGGTKPPEPTTVVGRALLRAQWLLLGPYVLVLTFRRGGFDLFIDGLLGLSVQWVPAALCWMALRRARQRRALLLVALAVTAYAAGSTFNALELLTGGSWAFPSPADLGFLLFYPLVLAGLFACVLTQGRRMPRIALLDGAVGSLGAGAILAVLLGPLLAPNAGHDAPLVIALAVAYPIFDLLTIAVAAGFAALPGYATGRYWALLLLGLTTFALTDVVYAYQVVGGSHQVGSLLDAAWAAGICLVATWAEDLGHPGGRQRSGDTANRALFVPTLATTAAVAVLVTGTRSNVPGPAVLLAAAAMVASIIRTRWAFRRLVTLEEVRRQARTDELTGLPNRRSLYDQVPDRTQAGTGSGALLLLDLDRFKEINDSLGHDAGDLLLTRVAERLSRCLHPADLIARIGGDEFAILLGETSAEESILVASRLGDALLEPFTLDDLTVQVSASVGIALFPQHGDDLKVLLRKAELAMYTAKTSRSGHHVHIRDDDQRGQERLRLLQELRTALGDGELILHYQPKIDLATGRAAGVEALVRWNHPERGLLYPGQFLGIAEEAGLMNQISNHVLDLALDQAAVWQGKGHRLTVAVNLPASSLIDVELPDRIEEMLQQRGLPGAALILEITEEFMMPDRDRAREILSRLRTKDIRISIDDFGTGYSSLAYLRDLPANEIKIDRSFVLPMTADPRAADLVASIINLAQSIGLTVVAEGVENSQHLKILARYACDQVQGFHICKPLPAPGIDAWLSRNNKQLAPTDTRPGTSPAS